jgi:nicotinamide-nucleotide amidase
VQAAIVTIGDEILAGRTQDTNSHHLAKHLAHLGITLKEIRSVSDQPTAIQLAIWELQERRDAGLVITTGGLGPTHDDRTVKAVADLHGLPLVQHGPTWQQMVQKAKTLHEQGRLPTNEPGPGARKTALVPQGATVLPNSAGAAPGLLVQRRLRLQEGTAWTLVLPGVPQEMRAIWHEHAEPWLKETAAIRDADRRITKQWATHTPESHLAPHLQAIQKNHPDALIGSYPRWGTTRVTLSITGTKRDTEAAGKELKKRLMDAGFDLEELPPESP